MSKLPYDIFVEPIEKWSENNYYGDFLVTISIDGFETTEILEFGPDNKYVWLSDWWEGQEDVKLLGFIPIDDILIYGSPDESQLLYERI
jgi:hypothetical protein